MKKRIVSFILVLSIITGIFSFTSFASSGNISENISYSFDSDTKTLTISGTGALKKTTELNSLLENAEHVVLTDGITEIGNNVFRNKLNLATVTLSDSIEFIGEYAFANTGIVEISIPANITSIERCTFKNCKQLKSFTISENIKKIGEYAFAYSGIEEIVIPADVEFGSNAFEESKVKKVIFEEGAKTIFNSMFASCYQLKEVILPDSITEIRSYAFYESSLEKINIGNNIEYVGEEVFHRTPYLDSIRRESGNYVCNNILFWLDWPDLNSPSPTYIDDDVTIIAANALFLECPDCEHDPDLPTFKYSVPTSVKKICSLKKEKGDYGIPDAHDSFLHEYGPYPNNIHIAYRGTPEQWAEVDQQFDMKYTTIYYSNIPLKDTLQVFSDVKEGWYKEFVDYAYTCGLFSGTSENTFSPEKSMTRAEFVQVIANLGGIDTSNKNVKTYFKDVPKGKWYTPAISWACVNGYVTGTSSTTFEPDAPITREQMCVILLNFIKGRRQTFITVEQETKFADDDKISAWAKEAVYLCQVADIVNGKGSNIFDPKGTATRAEVAVLLTKAHKDLFLLEK